MQITALSSDRVYVVLHYRSLLDNANHTCKVCPHMLLFFVYVLYVYICMYVNTCVCICVCIYNSVCNETRTYTTHV